jgi:hypothetical protein
VGSNASALSAATTEQDLRRRAEFLGIARPQTDATAMTYTIARYPAHLIDFVSAANGRRVTIRPMLPQDFKLHLPFALRGRPLRPLSDVVQ